MAMNNSNPQEMFAASGGDGRLGPLSFSGIYKTTDGGFTWAQANVGLSDPLVEALWLDQSNPSIVLAGTQSGGIFRSTDGAHWNPAQTCSAITTPVSPVTAFIQAGGILYAGSGLGLLRSTDDGATWCMEEGTTSPVSVLAASGTAIYVGLADGHVLARPDANSAWITTLPGTAGYQVWHLAAHPANPNICYAITNGVNIPPLSVTTDGGRSWTPVTTLNLPILQVIEFQPSNPQVIFAGWDGQIFVSTDGGATWPALNFYGDIRSIYPDAAGVVGRVIVGADQGIYQSTNNGTTWGSLNTNLTSSILYGISIQGSSILLSAQDYPSLGSFDGGRNWQSLSGTAEGGEIAVNPFNPSYAYFYSGGTVTGFSYSTDGGRTFQPAIANSSGLRNDDVGRAIAVDPSTPSTLYVAGEDGVYQSTDWGKTFTLVNWPILGAPFAVTVAPEDSRTIFVSVQIPNKGSQLYFTHDKGMTWATSVFTDVTPGLYLSTPVAIAFDPYNPKNVVAGLQGSNLSRPGSGVYVSRDGGNTFSPANNGIESPSPTALIWGGMISDVEFAPWYPGLLAASAMNGLYVSSDLGAHWINLRENSVPPLFTGLAWANGNLYATTFGEGVLEMPFAAPLKITPGSANVGPGAGTGSITVTASSATQNWTAASNAPWITVLSAGTGSGSGSISYSIAANSSTSPRTGAITIGGYTFNVYQGGAGLSVQPQITAVVNVDYSANIAPGSWIVIEGTNLATATGDWSNAVVNGALPTTLNNVSVTVDGKPAFVYFVSQTQINAQAPDDSTIGPVSVVVTSNGVASTPALVPMAALSPALLLWPQSYVVATHLDFSLAARNGLFPQLTTKPAQPGETIILWGTGLGSGPPAGSVPSTSYSIASPVVVHFGTLASSASAVASAPGEVAVDQIAVTVPLGLSSGDYTIGIEIGGTVYQAGKLSVSGP